LRVVWYKIDINVYALNLNKIIWALGANAHSIRCEWTIHVFFKSAVGVVTRLWAAPSGVPFPAGIRNSSGLQMVQTSCGVHPVSFSIGAAALSPRVKRPSRKVDHSTQSSSDVNSKYGCSSALLKCLHGME
jgi:hypothetical protein